MLIVKAKTINILKNKDISFYKLSKLTHYDESYISNIFSGKNPFPEKFVRKLLSILEVPKDDFESWILADKYPKELLERAIQKRKEFQYKRKSVLTFNIDKILEEKEMSRTALSKEIQYSQSGLNAMIIGKINMSKPVIEKISTALEIPQDEIQSWIVADKYKLELLEKAYNYSVS